MKLGLKELIIVGSLGLVGTIGCDSLGIEIKPDDPKSVRDITELDKPTECEIVRDIRRESRTGDYAQYQILCEDKSGKLTLYYKNENFEQQPWDKFSIK